MRKVISIGKLKVIITIILLISTCTTASAQSPYAMFGDNSKMLEAKKRTSIKSIPCGNSGF